MFHAAHFAHVQVYRDANWDGVGQDPWRGNYAPEAAASDRPLIAQFAGDKVEDLVRAAQWIESEVDAVDLNLGCPQKIAKRGHYGAFLLEEQQLIVKLLSAMVKHLKVPVTAKIRLLNTEKETLELAKAIEDTGMYVDKHAYLSHARFLSG
jgi:tRNA-dihydrouridine synthase 1